MVMVERRPAPCITGWFSVVPFFATFFCKKKVGPPSGKSPMKSVMGELKLLSKSKSNPLRVSGDFLCYFLLQKESRTSVRKITDEIGDERTQIIE